MAVTGYCRIFFSFFTKHADSWEVIVSAQLRDLNTMSI